jgi:ERCC4-type nuclease
VGAVPHIIIDVHEKETALAKYLVSSKIETSIKGGEGYNPTGDYIIIDTDGHEWGIERKAFMDCWNSIKDKRVFGQLAQLKEKYGERAIFMVEIPHYFVKGKMVLMQFPKAMQANPSLVFSAVAGLISSVSMVMPVWIASSQEDGAKRMMKFAKNANGIKLEGRGICVTTERKIE